jgi:hypothetical protein
MGHIDVSYMSLYDIYVRQGMIVNRTNIVEGIQPATTASSIFLIYTDFYENNKDIIDLAIQYSII